ncbi:hypothetical protein QYF50_06905 [Paenibacillus vini]|uniref:hypothetical protein n=1 Tax=Paenibacillus vini TaxID=1476024 RepID=UPI0025B6C228|nr:hypothetical protein [Paenibacillus vini]MDN4067620.1 hypothetical protein [Paenibacillus vini]
MKMLKDSFNQIINDFKMYTPRLRFVFTFGIILCLLGIADLLTLPQEYEFKDLTSKFAEMLTIMGVGVSILTIVDTAFEKQLELQKVNKKKVIRLIRIVDSNIEKQLELQVDSAIEKQLELQKVNKQKVIRKVRIRRYK